MCQPDRTALASATVHRSTRTCGSIARAGLHDQAARCRHRSNEATGVGSPPFPALRWAPRGCSNELIDLDPCHNDPGLEPGTTLKRHRPSSEGRPVEKRRSTGRVASLLKLVELPECRGAQPDYSRLGESLVGCSLIDRWARTPAPSAASSCGSPTLPGPATAARRWVSFRAAGGSVSGRRNYPPGKAAHYRSACLDDAAAEALCRTQPVVGGRTASLGNVR